MNGPIEQISLGIGLAAVVMLAVSIRYSISSRNKKLEIRGINKLLAVETVEAQLDRLKAEEQKFVEKKKKSQEVFDKLARHCQEYDEKVEALSMGINPPVFAFDDPESLKSTIDECQKIQFTLATSGRAIQAPSSWRIEGDATRGMAMIDSYKSMVLRSFNNEFDMIRKQMRHSTYDSAKSKLRRSEEQLDKLVEPMSIYISSEYIDMKSKELEAWHQALVDRQLEKEARMARRKILKEQNVGISEDEMERVSEDLQGKENELERAQAFAKELFAEGQKKNEREILKIQREIETLRTKQERAISEAQKTRAGYIYVISNIGSFGEGVVKIGMTRRLEPMDRVNELGDASVPFKFDVHTLVFVDDAPKLEKALHGLFGSKRVNVENTRKEFFRASPSEVEEKMKSLGVDSDWFYEIEAKEYRESILLRESLEHQRREKIDILDTLPKSI